MTLEQKLIALCPNVYFQAPNNVLMSYPCIRYELTDMPGINANDAKYGLVHKYRVDLISKNPLDPLRDQIVRLPYCRFDRFYVTDGLNHWVYTISEQ